MKLNKFFEAELKYIPEVGPFTSTENRIGELLGSGEGTLIGEKLKGKVKWDIYEDFQKTHCTTAMAGLIETDDGAVIEFDSRGFGIVPDSENKPDDWNMTATLKFQTKSEDYKWLERIFAVWDGTFDMSKKIHNYTAYIRET